MLVSRVLDHVLCLCAWMLCICASCVFTVHSRLLDCGQSDLGHMQTGTLLHPQPDLSPSLDYTRNIITHIDIHIYTHNIIYTRRATSSHVASQT